MKDDCCEATASAVYGTAELGKCVLAVLGFIVISVSMIGGVTEVLSRAQFTSS